MRFIVLALEPDRYFRTIASWRVLFISWSSIYGF